jgi:hypothetical protein
MGEQRFFVVRVHDDGTLEYLPDKTYFTSYGDVSDIAFVPPRKTEANPSWLMYH